MTNEHVERVLPLAHAAHLTGMTTRQVRERRDELDLEVVWDEHGHESVRAEDAALLAPAAMPLPKPRPEKQLEPRAHAATRKMLVESDAAPAGREHRGIGRVPAAAVGSVSDMLRSHDAEARVLAKIQAQVREQHDFGRDEARAEDRLARREGRKMIALDEADEALAVDRDQREFEAIEEQRRRLATRAVVQSITRRQPW